MFPLETPATAAAGAILAVILLTDNRVQPFAVQVGTALMTIGVLLVTLLLLSTRII